MGAWISLFLAVHKIARDCQANEDHTVAKQSSLYNIFLIDLLGKHLKILILSFEKKHISSMFWVLRKLVYRRYTRCIRAFATETEREKIKRKKEESSLSISNNGNFCRFCDAHLVWIAYDVFLIKLFYEHPFPELPRRMLLPRQVAIFFLFCRQNFLSACSFRETGNNINIRTALFFLFRWPARLST